MSEIILVNEKDEVIGYEEKLAAHEGGRLHRAFSVFISNSSGQQLLQLRSRAKYHFAGLWTNACCSHPPRGEALEEAVHRRLRFELGFDAELREACSFVYRAEDAATGLVEHEFDHVFVGRFDGQPRPNPDEVDDWRWIEPADLEQQIAQTPERFTPWLPLAWQQLQREPA